VKNLQEGLGLLLTLRRFEVGLKPQYPASRNEKARVARGLGPGIFIVASKIVPLLTALGVASKKND
jgi:hypothetical protein